jgi:hypothetical protein
MFSLSDRAGEHMLTATLVGDEIVAKNKGKKDKGKKGKKDKAKKGKKGKGKKGKGKK